MSLRKLYPEFFLPNNERNSGKKLICILMQRHQDNNYIHKGKLTKKKWNKNRNFGNEKQNFLENKKEKINIKISPILMLAFFKNRFKYILKNP